MNLETLSLPGAGAGARAADAARAPRCARCSPRVFAHGAARWKSVPARRRSPAGGRAPPRPRRAAVAQVVERRQADDGFVKYLFESPLGGRVEAVRIPLFDEKYVVCVSSQVGCALACDFCMTGKLGFQRNLQTWEILDQVLQVRAEADRPVRGVVFMGMGEPLLNYTETIRAAQILSHPAGFAISGHGDHLLHGGVGAGDPPLHARGASVPAGVQRHVAPSRRSARRCCRSRRRTRCRSWSRRSASTRRSRRERAMIAYVVIQGFNTGARGRGGAADGVRGHPHQGGPDRRDGSDRQVPAAGRPRSSRRSGTTCRC